MKNMLRACVAVVALGFSMAARAETPVKIGIGFGVGFLPMFIADEMKLVQKHAAAAGLDVTPSYIRFSGSSAMQDAVLSGAVDMGVYGVAAMLIAWDKARGTGQQVFGIAGVNSTPLVLVTNKAGAKDITDLGAGDKISMPAMVSPQMYALQMIAEKRYGAGQQDRFRTSVVALPHPESVNSLLTGATEVKAYFSTPPFTQIVLDSGKTHVLTTSEEAFGGRSTFLALGATKKYLDANPKMAEVMVKVLREAGDVIRNTPEKAAEIYLKVEPSKVLDVARVTALLKSEKDDFGVEVTGVKATADFMGRVGGLRRVPASYSDVFLPLIADTKSN
jgi:NitT/TauT family transport system substrate-binding protein